MTNLFRRRSCGEPAHVWRSLEQLLALTRLTLKATSGQITWLRTECRDGRGKYAERPGGLGEAAGSQSLHTTEAALSGGEGRGNSYPREGRQQAGCEMAGEEQGNPVSAVTATQGRGHRWGGPRPVVGGSFDLDGSHGVGAGQRRQGGKWFSLIDKVVRPATLDIAWQRVARNQRAAGVDGESIERFEAQAARYLSELQRSLTEDSYRPAPVKRVDIPKADGKTRPLWLPAGATASGGSLQTSTHCRGGGLVTSSTPGHACSAGSTR